MTATTVTQDVDVLGTSAIIGAMAVWNLANELAKHPPGSAESAAAQKRVEDHMASLSPAERFAASILLAKARPTHIFNGQSWVKVPAGKDPWNGFKQKLVQDSFEAFHKADPKAAETALKAALEDTRKTLRPTMRERFVTVGRSFLARIRHGAHMVDTKAEQKAKLASYQRLDDTLSNIEQGLIMHRIYNAAAGLDRPQRRPDGIKPQTLTT